MSTNDAILFGLCKTGNIINAAGVWLISDVCGKSWDSKMPQPSKHPGIIMAIAFSGLLFSAIPTMNQMSCYMVFTSFCLPPCTLSVVILCAVIWWFAFPCCRSLLYFLTHLSCVQSWFHRSWVSLVKKIGMLALFCLPATATDKWLPVHFGGLCLGWINPICVCDIANKTALQVPLELVWTKAKGEGWGLSSGFIQPA